MPIGNETPSLVPPPNVDFYENRYADAIFPLSKLMSDETAYDKEHWTYGVDADELTLPDLSIMEERLRKLKVKLQILRTANEKLTSVGDMWMDAVEKHTEKTMKEQLAKYRKLRNQNDVQMLQRGAYKRTKELAYAIIKMQTSYDKGRKQLEGKSISTKNGNRSG